MCPPDHFCPMGTTQPAPCPTGLRAPAGASTCAVQARDIVLYEVIMMVFWWALLVLGVGFYAYRKLNQSSPRPPAVIPLVITR